MTTQPTNIRLALEVGAKKTFASALDWPGWSRPGKGTPAAIETMLDYRDRYNPVVRIAGLDPIPDGTLEATVVDEVAGDVTTDFGAPNKVVDADSATLDGDELTRQLSLLQATWQFFDEVCQTVSPELKKGPRGGGRDRDKMIDHVIKAERNYARKIGVRTPPFDSFDRAAVNAHHEAVYAAIRDGAPIPDNGWPVRYAIRRMAWHVLDHAWEMQDKNLA